MSAAVLAGLVLGAAIAVALAAWASRARRRARLNRALHELRRPVQALSLALERRGCAAAGASEWVEQLRGALADLDAEVNGRPRHAPRAPVSLAQLLSALERRWRDEGVRVESLREEAVVAADPRRLGAALDNLIANALSHGRAPVRVRASADEAGARLEVRDEGPPFASAGPPAGDPRRGHGLGVVAEVAEAHGGALIPPRRTAAGGTAAAMRIPLRDPGEGA